jgi:DNA polymerase III alpha subunit
LKLEYPAHWLCGLLNAQPMGFYHPSVLVEDGKRHGVRTLPVDVTRSEGRCTLEAVSGEPRTVGERAAAQAVGEAQPYAVRLGFNYVRGLGPTGRAVCEEAVRAGATGSVGEFWRATRLHRPAMENLVMVGAFDAVAEGKTRREVLWELRGIEESLGPRGVRSGPSSARGLRASSREEKNLEEPARKEPAPPRGRGLATPRTTPPPEQRQPPLLDLPATSPPLLELDERERVAAEYRLSELSTGPHLLAFLRPQLDALGCIPLARAHDLQDKARTRVAGLVIVRQAPSSASGFRFFTLADEGGHLDLVLRPKVYQRVRTVANLNPLLLVDGVIEAEGGRLNLLVEQVEALDGNGEVIPRDLPPTSHDYH